MDNERNIDYNLKPGRVIAGRYKIEHYIGRGQVGIVYACRNIQLPDRLLAIKILSTSILSANPEKLSARFEREIVSLYRINHPNVVRNYDFVRDEDMVAYTMEYVDGGNLSEYLADQEFVPIRVVMRLLKQMCSGVQAIHEVSVIHRDLKPENILLSKFGKVKIADFGIARQLGVGENEPSQLTTHGSILGTFEYLSPEYLTKSILDRRMDIYALGILGYKLLLHRAPFKGNSILESIKLKLESIPLEPHRFRSDCPEQLSKIILKALNADPDKRFQTAEEMRQALFGLNLNSQTKIKTAVTPKNLLAFSEEEFESEKIVPKSAVVSGLPLSASRERRKSDSGTIRRLNPMTGVMSSSRDFVPNSRHLPSSSLSGSDLSTDGLRRGYEWVAENSLENTSEWILKIGIVLLITLVSVTVIFFSLKYYLESRDSLIQPQPPMFSGWE